VCPEILKDGKRGAFEKLYINFETELFVADFVTSPLD
jgi:hypothetical protein